MGDVYRASDTRPPAHWFWRVLPWTLAATAVAGAAAFVLARPMPQAVRAVGMIATIVFVRRQLVSGTYRGSLDRPGLTLVMSGARAQFVEPGWLVVLQGDTLGAQRYALASARLEGEPIVIARGVAATAATDQFAVSASTLVWATGLGGGVTPAWFSRNGASQPVPGIAPAEMLPPALSADGIWLAVHRTDPATQATDVWLLDLAHGEPRQSSRSRAPRRAASGRLRPAPEAERRLA